MKGLIKLLVLALVVFGIAFGGAYFFQKRVEQQMDGKVETIASASLQGLREQARLTAFVASFVAVVSSEQARFGLKAEQTMVLPGMVRYELDLNALKPSDVKWDKDSNTLKIALPPLILSGPEVDLNGIRQFDGGGILMALTDAESTLSDANRKRGIDELLKQAKGEVPMQLARDATARAIERSFAMPLRAAGIKATVVASFASAPAAAAHPPEDHTEEPANAVPAAGDNNAAHAASEEGAH